MTTTTAGRIVWAALLALCAGAAACKKTETVQAPQGDDLLLVALELQGGAKRLKRVSSFSAAYRGNLLGQQIKGPMKQRLGDMRWEYVGAQADPVVQVAGDGTCWQKIDRAVVPCRDEMAAHATRRAQLLEAAWLWPLQQRKDRKATTVKGITVAGKRYDGLKVQGAGGAEIGTLLVDTTSRLVVGLKMQTRLMGQSGEFIGLFSGFTTEKGVKIPTKREYTFDGKPFLREELQGILPEKLEAELFERPPQVKHGAMRIKNTPNYNILCTRLRGSLEGVPGALDKLTRFVGEQELRVVAPPMLVHRTGPPRVTRPAGFVTDVCLPLSDKSWTKKTKAWGKQKISLTALGGTEVLAGWGIGPLDKVTVELAGKLRKEARARGRKQDRDMYQFLYMPPGEVPADRRVSELHFPINIGG